MLVLKRDFFSLSLIGAYERAYGSYYKSIIAYINDDFIDKPTATFPSPFLLCRMGNT